MRFVYFMIIVILMAMKPYMSIYTRVYPTGLVAFLYIAANAAYTCT